MNIRFSGDPDDALEQVRRAQAAIDSIRGKTVIIDIRPPEPTE